ncbi:MAG: cysteine desulfurase [Syntrophobacterales bacterium]|nr:cysteine desulfurase [Syntrophobacterales bacterium]
MKPVYLDHNATTPVDPEVFEAMRPYLTEHFGNPSSPHFYGVEARKAVEKARTQVAGLLDCEPEDVVFTSGGTEANNHAIKGACLARRDKGRHIVTSAVEHPAVIEVCRYLETMGFALTVVPVDAYGMVDLSALKKALTPETTLISVMHANNEVGTVQPVEEISGIARERGILFHTDAAQAAGKIPVFVKELGVDLLSLAGHKLYAPKGVGVLYVKGGVALERFMHGAGHEGGRRAGTENVASIVALGAACELAKRTLKKNAARMKETRDRLRAGLEEKVGDIRFNGHPERCLPNTLSVSFRDIDAGTLLSHMKGVAASAGAACHGASLEISSVLKAMKVPVEYARGTVRFSTGKTTTTGEIDEAVRAVVGAVEKVRKTRSFPGD